MGKKVPWTPCKGKPFAKINEASGALSRIFSFSGLLRKGSGFRPRGSAGVALEAESGLPPPGALPRAPLRRPLAGNTPKILEISP